MKEKAKAGKGADGLDFEGQREGEELLLLFRKRFSGLYLASAVVLLVLAPAIGLCIYTKGSSWAYLVLMILLLAGIIFWLGKWLRYHFSYYLLTNQRLRQVKQKSFFKRVVVDLDLRRIMSISYGVSGFFGNIFDYGSVLIQTGAGDLVLSKVKDPAAIHDALQDAVHEAGQEEENDEQD